MDFSFARVHTDGRLERSCDIATALPGFTPRERWLALAPHDDDLVLGAALTIAAGAAFGAALQVAIATDGQNGYCSASDQRDIVARRRAEALRAYRLLGIEAAAVHWLAFQDAGLRRCSGRYRAAASSPSQLCGYDGLQNSLTAVLRRVMPRRVLVCTPADLHPDHKALHEELLISVMHASSPLWPELGAATELPTVLEYAVYHGFDGAPDVRIEAPAEAFARKLQALACFDSQPQIASLVQRARRGPRAEYLREVRLVTTDSPSYEALFTDAP